jgi:transcriptional regulator of acetoin/glycerol metabolism
MDRSGDTTAPTGGETRVDIVPTELAIQWVFGAAYTSESVLRGARLRVGRGECCHVRLEHASVSREHAEIQRQGPIYALRDLASTNGTRLNGRRVDHAVLSEGDVLRIGSYVGVVLARPRSLEQQPFGELAPGLFGGATLRSSLASAFAAAATDLPFVLVGETGTGKERVARAIHCLSGRRGRFHALNCSALPPALAEAELFGCVRGAFTGAERSRPGHLRAAHGGTLFLDEIADLPREVQAKLLRSLEEGCVVPLGDTEAVATDVRIVCASHTALELLVQGQRFRADLHARVAGITLELLPLRRRRDEIPGLFFHLLEKHGSRQQPAIDPKLVEGLCLYAWPGNVRELELFTRRALALRRDRAELGGDLVEQLLVSTPRPAALTPRVEQRYHSRREQDLDRLRSALRNTSGNLTAAAASAGISRRRAYRLLAGDGSTAGEQRGRAEDVKVEGT